MFLRLVDPFQRGPFREVDLEGVEMGVIVEHGLRRYADSWGAVCSGSVYYVVAKAATATSTQAAVYIERNSVAVRLLKIRRNSPAGIAASRADTSSMPNVPPSAEKRLGF